MELKTWTHDEPPKFARTVQGIEVQETTDEELACRCVPYIPYGNRETEPHECPRAIDHHKAFIRPCVKQRTYRHMQHSQLTF